MLLNPTVGEKALKVLVVRHQFLLMCKPSYTFMDVGNTEAERLAKWKESKMEGEVLKTSYSGCSSPNLSSEKVAFNCCINSN